MVSLCNANRAVRMDMLMFPTFVALPFPGAMGLNKVVFPAILTETFELMEGGRRGVSPGGGASAIISGALGGD